jgi:protein-L-isoaspartate(D-aspartate) O-methyltransferase
MSIDFEAARTTMIQRQVRPAEVLDPRVLEVLGTLHREDFVPPRYRSMAFGDFEVPLGHDEKMMKPLVEARMLQSLQLAAGDSVLEVGTGSGFVTACLAALARSVHSIDIHADFIAAATDRLDGITNVRLDVADALSFEPGHQFDAVAITGAVAEIPARFRDWVRPGGRLFVVRGASPTQEALLLTRHLEGPGWDTESLYETDLPYLRGAEPRPRFVL